jgi:CheY-like chemotaxis protein
VIKVLLIEDIEDYIETQRSALKRSNFEVLTAQTAPEAIRVARRERPRLVVLDLEMAERSGGDLIGLVRAEPALQNIPVLLLSARQQAEEVARQHGFAGVVRKPLKPAELIASISQVLNLGRRTEVRVLVVAALGGEKGAEKRIGRSVDLSDSGLLAEFSRPLEVGTTVELRFFLPDQPEGVTVRAEVARCAARGGETNDIGFRFTDVPEASAHKLRGFLAKAETQSRPALLTQLL